MKTVDFAGIQVDNISMAEAVERVKEYLRGSAPRLIVTPNPEIIVASQKDRELKDTINSADLRLPDGISMVVVSRILRNPLKERVTGIDLMLKIAEFCGRNGKKIFLLGGEPGVAEAAAGELAKEFPGISIVGTHNGYFQEDAGVIRTIRDARPDVLFAGIGAGRQEKWLKRHLGELGVGIGMGIGGSLDVISGRKNRAPAWIQKMYIEWLYRLATEPQRWKRQLALPKFLWLMFFRHKVDWGNG